MDEEKKYPSLTDGGLFVREKQQVNQPEIL